MKRNISKYLAAIGRKGGIKSGQARMEKLTPEQRSEIARHAVLARWAQYRQKEAAAKKRGAAQRKKVA